MSLRVWLPLNGSLENKGLDDITPVLTGAVAVDNEGKIGKCYKFGTSLGRITIPPVVMRNYTECSVTFWINILGWQTNWDTFFQAGLGAAPWNNYIFGVLRNTGNSVVFTISDASSSSQGNYKSSDLTLNTWYHLGFTYKAGHCCIYVNGHLYKDYSTTIIPNFGGINYISLGQLGNASSYQTNCKMNDFRIYDHALSPLEIKQISQGLILHYPLNRGGWGNENIIAGTEPTEQTYTYPSSGYKDKFAPLTTVVPTGDKYTLSFYAKSTVAGDKIRAHYYSPNTTTTCVSSQGITRTASDGNMDFTLTTDWKLYWVTYTQTETTAKKHIIIPRMGAVGNTQGIVSGTGTVSIKCIKFEEGDKPTPWCPNSSDTLYNKLGLNDNMEYDTSGYGNNGTRIGTFTWTSDTPKYNVSTVFNGTDNAIQTPSLPSMISDKNYTIAVWIYKTVIGSKGYQTIYGGPSGFEIEARNGGANETKFVPWNWGKPMASYELNEWNHCVFVHSDSDCKIYLNGEYIATGTAKAANPSGNYFVGAWNTATQQNFDGLMSDFRIYATALSAKDVKDLYELGATIDTNGVLSTYEFAEQ